ncbi:MAG: phage baseplate assembly protein V [Oscillospiraceae bacterium]
MAGLFEALNTGGNNSPEKNSVRNGIALAKVTNIKDPKNLGRVKCAYITSEKDPGETGWIFCMTAFGGNGYGAFFHLNVGDVVVLAFENGDIHRPFVLGSLWAGEAKPPITVQDGKNEEYKLITPNKSFVQFMDTKGKEKITVETPKKRQVILDDENQQMIISDGKNSLTINEKNGTTELKCDQKLTIKVGSGVTIECDGKSGSVNIKANKEISISAAQIKEKASGTMELSGDGSAMVKSSGMLTLKGSMTKIN